MIRPHASLSLDSLVRERSTAPWEGSGGLEGLALVTLWSTGADPERDGLFRLQALRRDGEGGWERFDRLALPFDSEDDEAPAATRRMAREFGVTGDDLGSAGDAAAAFDELVLFLADRPVIVDDRALFAAWVEHWRPDRAQDFREQPLLDLASLAECILPGRLSLSGPALAARLLEGLVELEHPRAIGPSELRLALAALIERAFARDGTTQAVLAHGLLQAWRGATMHHPRLATRLAFVLSLLESPSAWRPADGLFPLGTDLGDGRMSDALRAYPTLVTAIDSAEPAWAQEARELLKIDPVPPVAEEAEPTLARDDARRIDEIFQEHLPRRFAQAKRAALPVYREGQHLVAAEIASSFGKHELLLLHAPTGTGKTLAYLVPAIIWAYRNGIRVGVATYTRALQEQAMDREVPVALEALKRAGVDGAPRIALLKGRQNYLCWRAFKLQTPLRADDGLSTLAWTKLALFALSDPEGDLDRFPRGTMFETSEGELARETERLVRSVHAETGCCAHSADRNTCAAWVARRRAERAHVVVTNHAFALTRREFFRQLIFDECEHLHDVAHSAFSQSVSVSSLRDVLLRLYKPGATARAPLNKIIELAKHGSEAWECTLECIQSREVALEALDELLRALGAFKFWREDVGGTRDEADIHSLFREFVKDEPDAAPLLVAQAALSDELNTLTSELAQLSEHLDTLPSRGILRLRRTIDQLRVELDERQQAVHAWIPRREHGEPDFRPETFYDLESTPTGEDILAARVLLPHEYLGRYYYPDLHGAVLISATTWLKEGFEAASAYLGLRRAAEPLEEEGRLGSLVRTFRAPEAFDYGRVLVAAPRDAPSVREGKRSFLGYVTRFLAHLGERTRGRMLVLFTNADDCTQVGRELEPYFRARHIPLWYQRMRGTSKEELGELFRGTTNSILLGLDTFWYGADFPGTTLEYLVIVRLPYGVPDRYHHAQSAILGARDHRREIYMPRALAKLRQGFGRLMRTETDRGCVFLLDNRILDPRHRVFLKELPLRPALQRDGDENLARFVTGETDHCLHEALAHMGMLADIERRGLTASFHKSPPPRRGTERDPHSEIREEDVPY